MTHYDTLQVVPWADESVIRAAYRALMRNYHPDTNRDPEAQLRAREITAAFAVLGDPAKRAAYDAFPTLGNEMDTHDSPSFGAEQRSRSSVRSAGAVSVALVALLSLALAVWPQSEPRQKPQELRKTAANATQKAPKPKMASTVTNSITQKRNQEISAVSVDHPGLAQAARSDAVPLNDHAKSVRAGGIAPAVSLTSAKPVPVPRAVIAEIKVPKTDDTLRVSQGNPRSPAVASCLHDSMKVSTGECTDDRQAQVERIAAIFFKQSMDHADSQKRQLLMNARTRSAFSRTLCRSSECVTQTYLQQMRDTTEIMEGRVPTP